MRSPPNGDLDPAWIARFRRLAIALPEAVEQEHWARPSFRVRGRIFAVLWPDDAKAVLKFTPEQQHEHIESSPQTFEAVPGGWGIQGSTFARLCGAGALREAALRRVLLMAWRNAAPKGLRREAGAE